MDKLEITIIIPVYNNATILEAVFDSIENQNYPVKQIIIIDDASSDNSLALIKAHATRSRFNVTIVENKKSQGLAACFNQGIRLSATEFVITLHADCGLVKEAAIEKLVEPFQKENGVLVTYPCLLQPEGVWNKYNFWLKAQYSQWVGKRHRTLSGKFDCFRRQTLMDIGLFDNQTFRSAGEDIDIHNRLKKIGKVVGSQAEIIHLHSNNPGYNIRDYLRKNNQFAECYGALFRKHYLYNTSKAYLAAIFWRPLMAAGIIIPQTRIWALALSLLLIFWYKQKFILNQWWNPRILIFLAFNIILFFCYTYYFLKGFISGRQTI